MKKTLHLRLAVVGCLSTMGMDASDLEITPGGRLHLDYAVHDADVVPLDDNFLVRRARIGLDGKINADWSFEIVYDFAAGGDFKDAYLRYSGWNPGAITIGQFKVPFGLEELTSSNNITFIERALPDATFAPDRCSQSYRLCLLIPNRLATSTTECPRSKTCLTASALNSSV